MFFLVMLLTGQVVGVAQPQSLLDWLMVFFAQYLYLALIGVAVLFVAYEVFRGSIKRKDIIQLGLATLFIFGLSYLLAKLGGQLINDPRPFMTVGEGGPPLIPSSTDNGFPSDHTLISAVVAAVMLTRFRTLGLALLLGAILVGLARVYCRAHHLVDVAGSLIIVAVVFGLYQILVLTLTWRHNQNQNKPDYKRQAP